MEWPIVNVSETMITVNFMITDMPAKIENGNKNEFQHETIL